MRAGPTYNCHVHGVAIVCFHLELLISLEFEHTSAGTLVNMNEVMTASMMSQIVRRAYLFLKEGTN